jgi:hypothetical protein
MAVERFRSVEEMTAAPIRTNAQDAFARFLRHCARYRLISGRKYSPGVFRYRSLEQAQAARARQECNTKPK